MRFQDEIITNYDHAGFQAAFRAYFGEFGVQVKDWEGLFAEMTAQAEPTYLRMDAQGRVIGFIMFAEMTMQSWFFTAKCGFIREFWVEAAHRRQGHGAALLHQAEAWLRQAGCAYSLLTTDSAPDFYRKRGYVHQPGIAAKNKDDVFVKVL